MDKVKLDHLAGMEVSRDLGFNELVSLNSLGIGLSFLATTIWNLEASIRKEETEGNVQVFFFGHRPGTNRSVTLLMPCYFHWFGVSLCNFVRLVGFLHALQTGRISRGALTTTQGRKAVRTACMDYVRSVVEVQKVVIWRNKVAAHFAITDPCEEDNLATLDMSVMYPVVFSASRYRVSGLTLGYVGPDAREVRSEIPEWSVTEVYEQLAPRYWPDFRWPEIQEVGT
jgi:hypothetical protein